MLALAAASHLTAAGSDVVINEIMYHPPNDREDLQFIELFNRGASVVDLSRWSFTKGIRFTFPGGTTLSPGAYLVICQNRAAFAEQYGRQITALGDFSGHLSHGGEAVELSDAAGQRVDAVVYSDHEPWAAGADGYSPSLERICPAAPSALPENWAASSLPAVACPLGSPGRENDCFSTNLPPVISKVACRPPAPGAKATVTAEIADADGVPTVALIYRIHSAGTAAQPDETALPMQRIGGDARRGAYKAEIEGQPEGALVRFRIKAVDATGTARLHPSANEPRPTCSYVTMRNTNSARVAFACLLNVTPRTSVPRLLRGTRLAQIATATTRGNSAFIYMPPGGGDVLLLDHVQVQPRSGGSKVHFQRDRPFNGMTGINLIFEGPSRWVLAEPLAYEVYRLAGVPAPLTEHVRLWQDGRRLGYQLLIEQPNESFLRRNGRDDTGNLYKLIWQGHGIEGQHEKKTHLNSGHDDLREVINGLNVTTGPAQWKFIQEHFNVEEFVSYYAANICLQNWDGFHNNYFAYHDTGRTGRWEIYPWDEDKTWGDFDGASSRYDWYQMPLTMGMRGDRSPRLNPNSTADSEWGGFGGVVWWRPGGWFSAPLLANPEFRRRFLARLDELCRTVFTEDKLGPVVDSLEQRLGPEIALRAQSDGRSAPEALKRFQSDIQSFRYQIRHRREFIQAELAKAKPAR